MIPNYTNRCRTRHWTRFDHEGLWWLMFDQPQFQWSGQRHPQLPENITYFLGGELRPFLYSRKSWLLQYKARRSRFTHLPTDLPWCSYHHHPHLKIGLGYNKGELLSFVNFVTLTILDSHLLFALFNSFPFDQLSRFTPLSL
jgi:hypothetical protein